MLERASSYEAADCSSCDEASMLLMRMRLMDSLVWGHSQTSYDNRRQRQQQADLQQLKLMGFRHALSPQVLIPPFAPCPSVRHSDRVRSCHVSAFEDSLQVAMCFHGARMFLDNSVQPVLLARMRSMFGADSLFFRENNYNRCK